MYGWKEMLSQEADKSLSRGVLSLQALQQESLFHQVGDISNPMDADRYHIEWPKF